MAGLYFRFTLRLYGHVLKCLADPNFTGLDLFYHIKDCWKGRDTPNDLLLRPQERGLPNKIGEWCFDIWFDLDGSGASSSQPYYMQLKSEDLLWFLEDIVEAANASELFKKGGSLETLAAQVNEIGVLFERDEPAYWKQLEGAGRIGLRKTFAQFCDEYRPSLNEMRQIYANEIADRIVHDRQLCNFIAQTVMDIGFDGETVEGVRAQWVQRERWPARIKAILHARDRGKCASCRTDIDRELQADGHIDHMFPIARGGCNDIVNLQLLCSKCNETKSDRAAGVVTSIPQYIRRPKAHPKPKRT